MPTVDWWISQLEAQTGPEAARLLAIVKQGKADGMTFMSAGTWEEGHPRDVEELCKGLADFYEALPNAKPMDLEELDGQLKE